MCTQIIKTGYTHEEKYIHFFNADRNVELGFVQFGHHLTRPGYGYGPMIRDHYLIHFIKAGKGGLHLRKMVYTVPAGSCFLIYPHQIAYYEADAAEPWEYYWLGFCGFNAEKVLKAIGFSHNKFILPFKSGKIYDKIAQIIEAGFEHQADDIANYLHLGGLVREILYWLLADTRSFKGTAHIESREDTSGVFGKGNYGDQYVNIVSKIIQTSYPQSIRVDKIAEKLSINRSYLSSIFKKYTGKSIKQYLTSYRIEQSLVLLRSQRRPIADIANSVGFDDPLYFSRVFKKQMNCSPSEYRKKNI